MNVCGGCEQDFGSLHLFDRHRVGTFEYTYRQGLKMDPLRGNGRRCLEVWEMEERGWQRNSRGQWFDPVHAEAVRARFAPSERTAQPLTASEAQG